MCVIHKINYVICLYITIIRFSVIFFCLNVGFISMQKSLREVQQFRTRDRYFVESFIKKDIKINIEFCLKYQNFKEISQTYYNRSLLPCITILLRFGQHGPPKLISVGSKSKSISSQTVFVIWNSRNLFAPLKPLHILKLLFRELYLILHVTLLFLFV